MKLLRDIAVVWAILIAECIVLTAWMEWRYNRKKGGR